MPATRIGFIGLGIMGRPMALNLQQAGYPLTVHNRTPGKDAELVAGGATAAANPREAAAGADIVITIVTDTPDVEAVIFCENGVAAGARKSAVVVDMSTISPEATRTFAARLERQGLDFIDAPVSGGDVGAIQGTLTIMAGGKAEAFARARPVFEVMGKRVTHVGPAGAGQAVKACNQVLCALNMIGVCEALTLAKGMGLNLETMLRVVTGGAANSWALENLGPKIVAGDLEPAFMIRLIQKDLDIVLKNAGRENLPLPGTALAVQLFRAVQAAGGDNLGTQAMIKAYEELAKRKVAGAANVD